MQLDAQILRKAFEQLHPGLYRYNTKAEMDAEFEALERDLSHDQSLPEAFLAFSVFAARLKCGHTYPNFFNQKETIAAALFHGRNRVPFYFRWMDQKMVVTEDFTPGHRLPRGTEVLSVNGTPVQAILQQLMTIARADGSNDAKRIAYLEVTGDSIYEAFDVYFPMFFPPKSTTLQLIVRRPGEKNTPILNVEALTFEQRISPIKAREAGRNGGNEVLFTWKYFSNGVAYLGMPTWAVYNSRWDWKTWLNSKLDELAVKNAPALVVDLRGNEGGNDVGNEILRRLVASDLKISAYRRLVRYRQTPAELSPYLDTWDPSFNNWGEAAVELPRAWPNAPPVHYFALTKFDDNSDGDVIHPVGMPFHGKVYVLMDASNSSATFQFAQIVQLNKLGTLVGRPSGGNQRGINGGAFFFLRLPKSQIEMDLPLIGSFPASHQNDAGLTPDVLVTPTLQDIIEGRDAEMAKAGAIQGN
ncbi:MAG TPA: S41 family peptidase [Bryobacteraceae bacterium]|nr:S41 family peptidase [Bryobacteraceae bacterium]